VRYSHGVAESVSESNDWRVTITPSDPSKAEPARRSFAGHKVEDDLRRRLGGRIVVGAGDGSVFLYAGSENSAREAERVATELLGQEGITAKTALDRWHPIEEAWEQADVALPATDAEREAEHQRLEAAETAESLASGEAQWEARAEFPTHREAVAMANRLRGEGRTVIRRWRFLVVSANNEDDAQDLADHIRREAPSDARVRAEAAGLRLPFAPL
jgi:hypothetical protein